MNNSIFGMLECFSFRSILVEKMSGRVKKRRNQKEVNAVVEQAFDDLLRIILNNQEGTSPENGVVEDEEEIETQNDGMGVVETYALYWPSKLKIGLKHPDPVVCTASLASIESPEITYSLKIPESVIERGLLSALQLEAVAYCAQAHERHLLEVDNSSRAGFLIGKLKGVNTIFGKYFPHFCHLKVMEQVSAKAVLLRASSMKTISTIERKPFGFLFPMILNTMLNATFVTLELRFRFMH